MKNVQYFRNLEYSMDNPAYCLILSDNTINKKYLKTKTPYIYNKINKVCFYFTDDEFNPIRVLWFKIADRKFLYGESNNNIPIGQVYEDNGTTPIDVVNELMNYLDIIDKSKIKYIDLSRDYFSNMEFASVPRQLLSNIFAMYNEHYPNITVDDLDKYVNLFENDIRLSDYAKHVYHRFYCEINNVKRLVSPYLYLTDLLDIVGIDYDSFMMSDLIYNAELYASLFGEVNDYVRYSNEPDNVSIIVNDSKIIGKYVKLMSTIAIKRSFSNNTKKKNLFKLRINTKLHNCTFDFTVGSNLFMNDSTREIYDLTNIINKSNISKCSIECKEISQYSLKYFYGKDAYTSDCVY